MGTPQQTGPAEDHAGTSSAPDALIITVIMLAGVGWLVTQVGPAVVGAVSAGLGSLPALLCGLAIAWRAMGVRAWRLDLVIVTFFTHRIRGTLAGAYGVLLASAGIALGCIPWHAVLDAQATEFLAAAALWVSGVSSVVFLVVGWRSGRQFAIDAATAAARRQAVGEQLCWISGVSGGEWEASAKWWETADGEIVIVEPFTAVIGLIRNADRVAQAMPGWTIDARRSPDRAALRPMTRNELERAELAASSGGLVVGMGTPSADGRIPLTLHERTTDANAQAVEHWLRQVEGGLDLVGWDTVAHRATAARLSAEQRHFRTVFAGQLGIPYPHQLDLVLARSVDGGRTFQLTAPQLRTTGATARRRAADEVVTALGTPATGFHWRVNVDDVSATITIDERVDPLATGFQITEFERRFPISGDPAESFKSFPIAVTEAGNAVLYSCFQTLVAGQTGSGKGSVLWSILRGFLPALRSGLAQVYGIDPKGSEFIAPSGAPNAVFTEVATTPDAWAELVLRVGQRMDARKGQGRSLCATADTPAIILAIDELSALGMLDGDAKRAKLVQQELTRIASQGRSLLVFVVAAVQVPTLESVGNLRSFAGIRIALRSATPTHTDLILGDGAEAAGAHASRIEVATPANGYRTAGVGYMLLEGQPRPQRIRFPEVPDDWIEQLHQQFHARSAAADVNTTLAVKSTADDDPFL